MLDAALDFSQFNLERVFFFGGTFQAVVPQILKHRASQAKETLCRLQFFKQRLELSLQHFPPHGLAVALAVSFGAEVVGIAIMASFRPAGRQWRCAVSAGDESAQRKVMIQILARRRSGVSGETFLNLLEGLEANECLVVSPAQAHAPLRRLDHSGIDGARQQIRHRLIEHDTVLDPRELRLRFQPAFHFGLYLKATRRIAFKRFPDDGGERFIPHQYSSMIATLLVTVAYGNGEHVITAFHARLHFLQGLTSILQALKLPLRGDDGFNELALGRVLELEVQAFDGCVIGGQLLPQFQVKDGVPRKPFEVIENDRIAVVHLFFHELQHGDHARAFHEVPAARNIVVKDRLDLIPSAGSIFPAAVFLAMQSVPVVLLFLVGDPAVNNGFLYRRARHDRVSFVT